MATIPAKKIPICNCCAEGRVKTGLESRPLYLVDIKADKSSLFQKTIPVAVCEYCFPPETGVRTLEGHRPIAEIKVGDKVLTESQIFHPVTEVFQRIYQGALIEINAGSVGRPFRATPNHPLGVLGAQHASIASSCKSGYSPREGWRGTSLMEERHTLTWIKAEDLTTRSYLIANYPLEDHDKEYLDNAGVAMINTIDAPPHRFGRYQDRALHRVRSLNTIQYYGPVYNLKVANDPTYTVENILVHNCDGDVLDSITSKNKKS